MRRAGLAVCVPMILLGCRNTPDNDQSQGLAQGFEPPVVTNPVAPIEYPVELYEQQVEGVVLLHLYITETGGIVPESTRVSEGSGYPELDSAAFRGVDQLRFAPARQDGIPIATSFVQPVHFRHPELAGVGTIR